MIRALDAARRRLGSGELGTGKEACQTVPHSHGEPVDDPHELDADAQREFDELNSFLAKLAPESHDCELGSGPVGLEPGATTEQISRWSIVFRDVRRLTEIAAARDHLLRIPQCIAVRVNHLSSHEISVVLTASARLNLADLEAMLREALDAIASAATFEVVTSSTRPAV